MEDKCFKKLPHITLNSTMCGIFCFVCKETCPVSQHSLREQCSEIQHRGPDDSQFYSNKEGTVHLGFHRLAINHPTPEGNQPMWIDDGKLALVCNGEIYNHLELKTKYDLDYSEPKSDCEVILWLYLHFLSKYLFETSTLPEIAAACAIKDVVSELNGVYAFVLYDCVNQFVFATRDYPFGVRPLFMYTSNQAPFPSIGFASEAKALVGIRPNGRVCQVEQNVICMLNLNKDSNYFFTKLPKIRPFYHLQSEIQDNKELVQEIQRLVRNAVHSRLMSDRPIGCFLSGGLDSSVVTAITLKYLLEEKKIETPRGLHTFSIGMQDANSRDIECARKFASELGTTHHEVYYTLKDGLEAIPKVIQVIESFDTTTIRASVPMYLLSKYIREHTDIKVLMSGEGADELFGGYLYLKSAPSPNDFDTERYFLLQNLMYYDLLRSDRTTAVHGLEIRVPLLDRTLAKLVANVPGGVLQPFDKQEKWTLREAAKGLVPDYIRLRQKDAFSDAVGHSWVQGIKDYFASREFSKNPKWKPEPRSNEEIFYRHVFEKEYPGRAKDFLPGGFWHPKWTASTVKDPSARVLIHYDHRSNNPQKDE